MVDRWLKLTYYNTGRPLDTWLRSLYVWKLQRLGPDRTAVYMLHEQHYYYVVGESPEEIERLMREGDGDA